METRIRAAKQDKTVSRGQSGQVSHDRLIRTGKSGKDIQDRTLRTGQSGQDSQDKTVRAGHLGQENKEYFFSVVKGSKCRNAGLSGIRSVRCRNEKN